MKPKANTLQERMGFKDSELSTPEHDQIILGLIRYKGWVARFLMPENKLRINDHYSRRINKEKAIEVLPSNWKDCFEVSPIAITEVPVKSGNFIVGFIDLVVTKGCWNVWEDDGIKHKFVEGDGPSFAIEVKPRISSFGETMRQVRYYQEFMSGMTFAICSPDQSYKEAFEEQGVRCFSPADVAMFCRSEVDKYSEKKSIESGVGDGAS